MITEELLTYVKRQMQGGVTEEKLRSTLLSGGGWDEGDINEAFGIINAADANAAVNNPAPTPASSPAVAKTHGDPVAPAVSSPVLNNQKPSTDTTAPVTDNKQSVNRESASVSPQAQEKYTATPTGGKLKKVLLSFIITLVVLGIAGGGAYAYFKYFQVEEHKLPHEVLALSFEAGKSVDSWSNSGVYSVDLTVKTASQLDTVTEDEFGSDGILADDVESDTSTAFDVGSIGDVTTNISAEFNGDVDRTERDNIAFGGAIKINVETLMGGFNVNMDLGIDIMLIDKKFYFRIPAEAPDVILFFDLTSIKDKWIVADLDEVIELSGGRGGVSSLENLIAEGEAVEDQIAEGIRKYFADVEVQALIDRIFVEPESEEVMSGGVPVYSYSVRPTRDDWTGLLIKSIEILYEVYAEELGIAVGFDAVSSEEIIDEIMKEEVFLDILSNFEFELTIGKEDFLPRSVDVRINFADIADGGTVIDGDLEFITNYNNYNKEFSIEAPGITTPIKEAMEALFGGLISMGPTVGSE